MSFEGTVEVCHIETPAGRKGRLEKGSKKRKKRTQAKGKTNLKITDVDSNTDKESEEPASDVEVDGIQGTLAGKRRKSHTDDEEYRPQKKGRTE